MSQRYDRFMVATGVGTNRKLRRLPVAQRWAYVAGVLALAAQSPIRGALLIADGEPVTDEDVAEEATIPVKDARAAMESLRRLGMLDRDEHGIEWVHGWDRMQRPDPKRRPFIDRAATAIQARIEFYGGLCWMCGAPWEHIDHVKPLARGGSELPANLRPACAPCNTRKGARWPVITGARR